jgi:hypothetical protein
MCKLSALNNNMNNITMEIHSLHNFYTYCIALFICLYSSMALQPLLDPGLFFSFAIVFYTDGRTIGRGISQSQSRYLHIGQHKHRINAHTDIHALSGIRTHDPSVRASKDSSCLRLYGHYDRRCIAL